MQLHVPSHRLLVRSNFRFHGKKETNSVDCVVAKVSTENEEMNNENLVVIKDSDLFRPSIPPGGKGDLDEVALAK